MKARKILAALGAALMMIGVSAPASAFDCGTAGNPYDKDVIAEGLRNLAIALRCDDDATAANLGEWTLDPIWQKRGGGDCEPQNSLARKLHEQREFKPGTKPRPSGNNTVAGASGDVRNEKYLNAVDKLDAFVKDAYKKKLYIWIIGNDEFENSLAAKTYFINEVDEARMCVCHLTECED